MRLPLLAAALLAIAAPGWAQPVVGPVPASQIGAAGGVAALDSGSHVLIAQLPTGNGANQVALGSTVAALSQAATIAAAGSTQAGATPFTTPTVYVTATAAAQGIILVTAIPTVKTVNVSSYAILVYPPSGGTINGLSANAPVQIIPGGSAQIGNPASAAWSAG